MTGRVAAGSGTLGGVDGERWDAVVAGASFGGLAAALGLAGAGRVLLVDRAPIGDGQTSACAAPLPVLERLGALDTVEQVHDACVFHVGSGPGHPFPTRHRWATFDYRRFCETLFARTGAAFVRATVRGLEDGQVVTSAGTFAAPIVIDATGWRAVLARPGGDRRPESLGLEVRLPGRDEGLHFWIRHEAIRHGYAWDFPAGDHRRLGVITYRESGRLRDRLDRFLGAGRTAGSHLHGGGLPSRLRAGTAGSAFVVGDAAGQCFPLTGEGIRPALAFGHAAGRLAARVLAGEQSLPDALLAYRRLLRPSRPGYAVLEALQAVVGHLPMAAVGPACWAFDRSPLRGLAERAYWASAPLELLPVAPGAHAAV